MGASSIFPHIPPSYHPTPYFPYIYIYICICLYNRYVGSRPRTYCNYYNRFKNEANRSGHTRQNKTPSLNKDSSKIEPPCQGCKPVREVEGKQQIRKHLNLNPLARAVCKLVECSVRKTNVFHIYIYIYMLTCPLSEETKYVSPLFSLKGPPSEEQLNSSHKFRKRHQPNKHKYILYRFLQKGPPSEET